jgi:hypothetical protein
MQTGYLAGPNRRVRLFIFVGNSVLMDWRPSHPGHGFPTIRATPPYLILQELLDQAGLALEVRDRTAPGALPALFSTRKAPTPIARRTNTPPSWKIAAKSSSSSPGTPTQLGGDRFGCTPSGIAYSKLRLVAPTASSSCRDALKSTWQISCRILHETT